MSLTRYEEASKVPFRSLHAGRSHTKEESHAVATLQHRLKEVQVHSFDLPDRLLHRPTPFSPPRGYGPFEFGQESVLGGNPHFGRMTEIAVKKFQKQVNLEEDGKAGINTLGKLNERFEAIQQFRKVPA